jgi:hypothetical protein
VLIIVNFI